MRDLRSRSFDRTGRRRPDRLTVRLFCPKAQQMHAWRSCWSRHLTWCRRRRPRRRPRGLERVPGAWWCRIHRPTTPKRTPPLKTRRRKMKILPLQPGETRKGRPPQPGRPEGPRREGLSFRTAPPPPMKVETSGCPGRSPRGDRKYSDTKVTHRIPLSHCFS